MRHYAIVAGFQQLEKTDDDTYQSIITVEDEDAVLVPDVTLIDEAGPAFATVIVVKPVVTVDGENFRTPGDLRRMKEEAEEEAAKPKVQVPTTRQARRKAARTKPDPAR